RTPPARAVRHPALAAARPCRHGRHYDGVRRMTQLRIAGGSVYDPANGVDGDVRDICIEDGRIVASLSDSAPRLDARGMVVMPGGVDMHCHVASGSVNVARRLLPEEHNRHPAPAPSLDDLAVPRSGAAGTVRTSVG